ncbi:MAG: NapC/NirT family cytochrome c [Cyclobacteriaceae bacterium]|nr:NapC/NirT family cytochrome c [Cyclobacteriaceae bacterium]
MKFRLPSSTQNWISLVGITIAAISFFMAVFLFTISQLLLAKGNYLGLVTYIILPMIMIVGLLFIPIGMVVKRKKMQQTGETPEGWPRIDLNDSRYRNAFFIFVIGSTILLFASAIGSYEAFHFTESVEFCGELCHSVMEPEHVAYQYSSHAKVACVDCHVGSGVDWYARSKLSGLHQVVAVLSNSYQKPISTPIANLRPARETCEECHWPQKFYANSLRLERHYLTDEENTEWDIHLQMKTSSGISANGLSTGIHWHINPDVQIDYFPGEDPNETIPWVKYINKKTGEEHIYTAGDEPDALDDKLIRTMDCMDCHNRPSHIYKSPDEIINHAMALGEIDRNIPEIRQIASEALIQDYSTNKNALDSIKLYINNYYQENYPDDYDNLKEKTSASIISLQRGYSRNFFPEMKVRWDVYPDHIGHKTFPGCMRCHDGKHIDQNGRPLSHECNVCHTVLAQGQGESLGQLSYQGVEFKHPEDIDEEWKTTICSECHNGE